MSEEVDCVECGDTVPEDDAVYGNGGITEDGANRLADGETVSASELFEFDDGPYCSLTCPINS